MTEADIAFVNTTLVPVGLMVIMFSLGLSLGINDFKRLGAKPKACLAGLSGQLIILPLLAFSLVVLFNLPAEMAVGLMILAACPGGVTSNALVFALRGDVALSVTLTAIASLITIFTTPFIISFSLAFFFDQGAAPVMSVGKTVEKLFQLTVLPISIGMIVRVLAQPVADKLIVYLRPTSMIVLISVIGFSVYASLDLVLDNLIHAGPVAYLLNVLSMLSGWVLAKYIGLERKQIMTVSIEVGVQNATMATFLTLSILNSWNLAIAPTIYGCIMLFNAALLGRIFNRSRRATKPKLL